LHDLPHQVRHCNALLPSICLTDSVIAVALQYELQGLGGLGGFEAQGDALRRS